MRTTKTEVLDIIYNALATTDDCRIDDVTQTETCNLSPEGKRYEVILTVDNGDGKTAWILTADGIEETYVAGEQG